jgi:hypothetical protein
MRLPKLYPTNHLNKKFNANQLSKKVKSVLSYYDDKHLLKSATYLNQIVDEKLDDDEIEIYDLSLFNHNAEVKSDNASFMTAFLMVFQHYSRIDSLPCYFGETLPEINSQIDEFRVIAKRLKGYMEDGLFYGSALEYISAYEEIKKVIKMMPSFIAKEDGGANSDEHYVIYFCLFQLLKDYIKEEYVKCDNYPDNFGDFINFSTYIHTIKFLDIIRKAFGCYNLDYIHTSNHFNTVGDFLDEIPPQLITDKFMKQDLQEMGVNVIELGKIDLALDNIPQLNEMDLDENDEDYNDDEDDGKFNFNSSVRTIIEPLIDISQQIGLSPNFIKYISNKYQG